MAGVEFEEYKGHKLICIPTGEYKGEVQYLKMGVKKVKAVFWKQWTKSKGL